MTHQSLDSLPSAKGLWIIPSNWKWLNLSALIEHQTGTWGLPAENSVSGLPVIRSTEIDGYFLKPREAEIRTIDSASISKYFLQDGDILVNKSSGSTRLVGWPSLFEDPKDGQTYLFSNFMLRLRSKGTVLPKYLLYYLHSPAARNIYLGAQATTSGLRNLRVKEFLDLLVPIPHLNQAACLETQRRVVARIEALLAEVRSSGELLEGMRRDCDRIINVSLEEVFQKLITEYELEFLGGDSTKRSYIQHLTSGSRGWSKYSSSSNTGPLFIRAGNVDFSRMDLREIERLNLPPDVGETERSRVRTGDVLVTITGANTGECCVVPDNLGEAYVNQHVALVRLTRGLEPRYLMWFILSPSGGVSQTAAMQYGQTKPGLSLTNIRNFRLPVPSKTVQRQMIAYLDSIQAEVAKMIELMDQDAKTLDLLEQSILERAFRGEL